MLLLVVLLLCVLLVWVLLRLALFLLLLVFLLLLLVLWLLLWLLLLLLLVLLLLLLLLWLLLLLLLPLLFLLLLPLLLVLLLLMLLGLLPSLLLLLSLLQVQWLVLLLLWVLLLLSLLLTLLKLCRPLAGGEAEGRRTVTACSSSSCAPLAAAAPGALWVADPPPWARQYLDPQVEAPLEMAAVVLHERQLQVCCWMLQLGALHQNGLWPPPGTMSAMLGGTGSVLGDITHSCSCGSCEAPRVYRLYEFSPRPLPCGIGR
jgi:hypothetical protein